MANPFDNWIDVFRAGNHTDSNGTSRAFSEADLDSVVANHSAEDAAPIVVGHPKTNDPAFGWTSKLRRVGDRLQAMFNEVAPEFSDAVGKGHYKKRSVRIGSDDKGGWKLLHVGWLGATPPAISGLSALNYETPETYIDFEMADSFTPNVVSRSFRRLREWLLDHFDAATADRVLPSSEIDALDEHARTQLARQLDNPDNNPPSSFSKPDNPKDNPEEGDNAVADKNPDTKQLQADLDKANAENKRLSKQVADHSHTERRSVCQALVDTAVDEHKLSPAQAAGLPDFMASLPAGDEAQIDFSVGENKTRRATPSEFFADFVKALPEQAELKSLATEKAKSDAPKRASSFSVPAGAVVDAERVELHTKALEYQREHKCDYMQAVQAVEATA